MNFLNNTFAGWFIGIFIVYLLANRTPWFNGLQKEQRWYYALGWPFFLPYYLYQRYQVRDKG